MTSRQSLRQLVIESNILITYMKHNNMHENINDVLHDNIIFSKLSYNMNIYELHYATYIVSNQFEQNTFN